ncbi:MAG: hypothetical protein RMI56_04000 [Sulfolobales archaeon]|nr:hypothetical protein [Sulfolobales archaeon]MDW8082946.1 hypothetical protein [Sulfolobales archaeon]
MRKTAMLVVAGSVALAAITIALALAPLLEVRIEGVVEVSSALKTVDVNLVIDSEEGSQDIDLGEIKIPKGKVVTRVVLLSREGEFNISISGLLVLKSEDRSYRIPMPCAISIGEPCYRVMVIIPGYDAPMSVEEDTYRATLELNWRARGSGRFSARLYLEKVE